MALRTAVIGAGSLGRQHARVHCELANEGSSEFIAVCDLNAETARTIANERGTEWASDFMWSGDGRFLFITGDLSGGSVGGTMVIPWRGADVLPESGLTPETLERLGGVRKIAEMSVAPSSDPSRYAFARTAEQSNLYRIRLPSEGAHRGP